MLKLDYKAHMEMKYVYAQVYFVVLLTKGKQPPELAKNMHIELSP